MVLRCECDSWQCIVVKYAVFWGIPQLSDKPATKLIKTASTDISINVAFLVTAYSITAETCSRVVLFYVLVIVKKPIKSSRSAVC